MIRRSLRKYKDDDKIDSGDDNTEKQDSDSDNNINSDSDDYAQNESDESDESDEFDESDEINEFDESAEEEYNNINKKKRKAEKKIEDEVENIPNIKLNEKLLKGNVILVLNNRDYFNNYDDENDENDENDEVDENNENNENDEVDEDDNTNIQDNVKKKQKYNDILIKYNRDEKIYFNNLNEEEKNRILNLENNLKKNNSIDIPTRFKLLDYDINSIVKNSLIYSIEQLNCMSKSSSEYFKLHNWINTLSKIPIGKYNKLDVTYNDDVSYYLETIKKNIDNNIYGHIETKEQIVRILAQWISNPEKTGYVIGIKGPPGVGKTKLVKECICKAMNFPLAFISLGGIDDASYLSGFNYTYEGSRYGKILECLIKSEVMNPVFLFDELDKVSTTSRGDEIINTLIHITDSVQNDKYTDKYFQEIDLDLSKSIIIFTYNNEDYINPILKDRMITINVNGYNAKEKLEIAKNYLIDELLPKYNMKKGDIIFEDKLLSHIISLTSTDEGGVRNLKREINNIISWINMMRYIKTDNSLITLPFEAKMEYYNKYCKKITKKSCQPMSMYL